MNEQDRELLFIDLCGRLPYGVKCSHPYGIGKLESIAKEEHGIDVTFETPDDNYYSIDDCKPYLFPMSSMTEEQKIECFKGTDIELDEHNEIWSTFPISNTDIVLTNLNNWLKVINWLNKKHFDYRGLIEKGLAIDASVLNIY